MANAAIPPWMIGLDPLSQVQGAMSNPSSVYGQSPTATPSGVETTNEILRAYGVTAGYQFPAAGTGFEVGGEPWSGAFGGESQTQTPRQSVADIYYGEDSPLGQGFNWKSLYPSST